MTRLSVRLRFGKYFSRALRFGNHATHCRFKHGLKREALTGGAIFFQTNGRLNLRHAAAQFNLGEMYETGRGVPQDVIMAHMWFNLAASRAMTAMDYLIRDQASQAMAMDFVTRDQALRRVMEGSWLKRDEATHRRDGLVAEMTPAQIAEAQRMAWEWMQSHPSTR
jgi:TPR repeat protein